MVNPAAPSPHFTAAPAGERPQSRYASWAGNIGELCGLVESLAVVAAEIGEPPPTDAEWYGQLFGKLRPQVTRDPVLVAAVCGGTNTGKSLITNVLVGGEISRSVPEAARTRCAVASLPRGLAGGIDLAALFPGFTPRPWTDGDDALGGTEQGDDLLFWREDPSGRQPERLILVDTPDVDGTLRENWQRAEAVRNACDVIIALLTQQKYNDAAVRDFFAAAAAANKSLIVVFNMVSWPAQRQRIAGWLSTFNAETGAAPLAVYAVPHDFARAEAGAIEFFQLPELTGGVADAAAGPVDLAAALSGVDFDRIKLRAMEGAYRVVLDSKSGMGGWLDRLEASSRQWQEARGVLAEEARVRVELPAAPRELVWSEIWDWLEPKRSRLDLGLTRVYRMAGSGVAWLGRRVGIGRTAEERQDDFAAIELAALKHALAEFIDRLDAACRRNPRLGTLLGNTLVQGDRASWYADLERRHAALPMVSDDYRTFVRGELDRFSRENPKFLQLLLTGLSLGSVARPCVTVGLFLAGSVAVPAAAAGHGLATLVHTAGDWVVCAAAPLAGEGVLGLTMAGLKPLIERLFAGWSAERSRALTETLHDVVLGDRLEEIDRRAGAAARPEVARARRLLHECGLEFSR